MSLCDNSLNLPAPNGHEHSIGKSSGEESEACEGGRDEKKALTAAQRARIERNRLRARALHDARLIARPNAGVAQEKPGSSAVLVAGGKRALDTGGGFLLEEPTEAKTPRAVPPSAPLVHHSEQPHCLECERPFPQSYLFDTFDYSVCDACRDDDEVHSLITRTEAKTQFLLKDCDLDLRPPPLRCIRRRNPHRSTYSDMRLYLRVQVEERALEVWGSEEALEKELELREEKKQKAKRTHAARELRALRLAARSSLFRRGPDAHEHAWAAEECIDEAEDLYSRTCTTCGHKETYEKM